MCVCDDSGITHSVETYMNSPLYHGGKKQVNILLIIIFSGQAEMRLGQAEGQSKGPSWTSKLQLINIIQFNVLNVL